MAIFEQKFKINPNENVYGKLNNNQESVFNEFLENVTDLKIDARYGDEQHTLLRTDTGKIYYFDSYKFIYPVKYVPNDPNNRFVYPIGFDGTHYEVINNDVGAGEITRASLYEGSKILVEHFISDNMMKRLVYNIPDNLLQELQFNNSFGFNNYLLNVSSLHPGALQGLEKESELAVVSDGKTVQCRNENGEIIAEQPVSNTFFNDSINIIGNVVNSNSKTI